MQKVLDKRILVLFGVVMLALVSIPVALYSFDLFDVRKIFTGAETEVTPSNVYVTNLTESGVTVTWTTLGTPVEGQVKYGTTASGQLDQVAYDDRASGVGNIELETHHVSLRGLEPDTNYSFAVVNNGQQYTTGSPSSFTFRTATVGDSPSVPTPIIGSISDVDTVGQDSIIYIYLSNGNEQSVVYSTTSQLDGNFSIDVGGIRSSQVSELFPTDSDATINLYVAAKTELFNKTVTDWSTELGTIQLLDQVVGFDFPSLDYTTVAVENNDVTIANVDEGESVTTLTSVSGEANPNEDLVVTITGPTFISDDIVANSSGTYRYNVTRDLESGSYSLKVASVSREGASTTVRFSVAGATTANDNTDTTTDPNTNTDNTNTNNTNNNTDYTPTTDNSNLPETGIEDYWGVILALLIIFSSCVYTIIVKRLD